MKAGSLQIKIKEEKKQYPIYFLQDEILKLWKSEIQKSGEQIFIITDDYVWKLYRDNFETDESITRVFTFPNGEEHKNLDTVQQAYQALYEMQADRNTVVVAIGGGVVGDLAGFVAASYLRGIRFIQVPTTLLAQVDSSLGGKVGVNFNAKNVVGFFYQPSAVYVDSFFWKTLDERQWLNGLGEMIKYAFLIDREYFFGIYDNKIPIRKRTPRVMNKLIKASLMYKQRVIELDEKENALRRLLNLGHTLGHAIEAAGHYQKYLHGEAVLLGLKAALFISHQRKLLNEEDWELGIQLIDEYCTFSLSSSISDEQLLELLKQDKKRMNGKNVWILVEEIGKPKIVDDVKEREVLEAIEYIRQE
jgi:3-dehydroquinate synthase